MKTKDDFIDRISSLRFRLKGEKPTSDLGYMVVNAYRSFYGETHRRTSEVTVFATKAFDFGTSPGNFAARINNLDHLMRYIEATVQDLKDGWDTDYMAAARAETEGDLLSIAEDLVGKGAAMAAAMVAGAVLENHLRSLCTAREIVPKDRGISAYNDKLKGRLYEKVQWREVQVWGDLRNAADHHDVSEFDASKVPGMISGIRLLIETHPA